MIAMNHRILFVATAAMLSAWVPVQAGSETAQLRALIAEQERQIRMLEEENTRLRADAALRESRNAQATGVNLVSMASAATPASPTRAVGSGGDANQDEYTVVAGDNLARIGRNFGTSAQAIAKANGIGEDMIIRPGQKLKIPAAASASESTQPATAPAAPVESRKTAMHTVAAGETFYSISRQHNISVDRLMAANPDTKPAALRVGQKIQLPQSASSFEPVVQAGLELERAPATPSAQEPAPQPAPENRRQVRTMMIDGEMSYAAFAAKHGTTPERLNQLNGLDLDGRTILAKGSELYVPAQP